MGFTEKQKVGISNLGTGVLILLSEIPKGGKCMVNTKLEELNLLDKFLFDEAMEDKETCQTVIGILLENEVELLGKTETEKEFRISPELRQVRLDVVGNVRN